MPPLAKKSVLLNTLLKIFCLLVVVAVNCVFGVCDSHEFKVIDECVCPGYTTAVYKCTVFGNGFTQWNGSAFNCPDIGDEIFLSHTDFGNGIRKECNNGAIIGQSLHVNGSCYTSQLTVNTSTNLNGTTIGCTYEIRNTLELIGATTLIRVTDSLSPPKNVRLLNVSPGVLVFNWTRVPSNCSAITYEIRSSCGECPTFTNSTSVSCIIQNPLDGMCGFAVRSVVCNNMVGGWSNEIEIMLRVPNPPMFSKVSSRYDPTSLLGLDVQFSHSSEDSFIIFNDMDVSLLYYTVTFNDSVTHEICASTIISPSSCSDVCVSSLPLSCFPLRGNVMVSVSATNALGKGPTNSVIIENTNQYVHVTAESTDNGRITCTFLNQQDVQMEKLCNVLYGPCAEQLSYRSASGAANGSGSIAVTVQLDIESDIQDYCYATIANNGTFSVLIEGNFNSMATLSSDCRSSCSTFIGALSINIILLLVAGLCIVIILYIAIRWRRKFNKISQEIQIMKRHHDEELSNRNYNDTHLIELPNITCQESSDQILAQQISQSESHEQFRAHIVFDLPHVPWKLLSALKIFKDMNIVDTRIMYVDETTRRVYILFESDPEEGYISKKRQAMTHINLKVPFNNQVFVDIHDESETKGCGVYNYKRRFPPESGSLYKFLEGIKNLSQKNSQYDLINIVRIIVQPSSDNDGSKVIELQFTRELPSNWKEEFNKIKL